MDKLISRHFDVPDMHKLAVAEEHGVYTRVRKALEMEPQQIIDEVTASNLRGLGGAGFPAGRKWGFLPKDNPKPRYLVVNADEGEPGTCKDKYVMQYDPHLLLEGIMITCWAIQSHTCFIYIRGEYEKQARILEAAITEAKEAGYLGKNIFGKDFALEIIVHRGAGAYICGEETSLLNSLEGKRGWPRLKPPFPAVEGYLACPTIVNNVETIGYVPWVIELGGEKFAEIGCERNGGMRLYSISGCVNKPGVYELPLGTNLKEMIYEHAGGLPEGRELKGVIPGGSSAPILTPDEIDIPMDFDSLAKAGSMLGSAGIVVFDDSVDMVQALAVIIRFYAHESCGQCTPCREGTGWLRKIIERILDGGGRSVDVPNMHRISQNIIGNSICPLGEAAALPVIAFVTKYKDEFEAFIGKKQGTVKEVSPERLAGIV